MKLKVMGLALLFTAQNILATQMYFLEKSIVSQKGLEQDLLFAPGSVSVITKEELQTRQIHDLGEALMGIPGVDVTPSGVGTYSFSIRGFGEGRTLVLVDGKRINEVNGFRENFNGNMYATGEDNGYIPPISMIERIEVIRGGASTLYGSDAIGGVINIITKKLADNFSGSISLETKFQQHPNEYGNQRVASAVLAFPLTKDKLSLSLRGKISKKDPMNLKYPNSDISAPGASGNYSLGNIGARATYKFDSQNIFYLDGEHFSQNTNMKRAEENNPNSPMANRKVHRNKIVLNHDGNYTKLNTNTYFQIQNSRHKKGSNLAKSNLYIAESNANIPVSFGKFGDLSLLGGLNYQYDDYLGGNEIYRQNTFAPYINFEYFIQDNLSLGVGARYAYSDLFDGALIPRAFFTYQPLEWLTFKGGISKGYSAPRAQYLTNGIYDSGENNRGETYDYYGNPNIKPEESTNYEFGVNFNLNHYANLSLTGFIVDFKNELFGDEFFIGESLPNGQICQSDTCYIQTNRGKNQSRGVEVGLNTANFYGFSLEATYTYLEQFYKGSDSEGLQKNRFGGERVEGLPRHIGMVKLNYKNGKFSSFLSANGRFDILRSSQYQKLDGSTAIKYKDYYTLNLGASYKISKNITLSATINNLLDQNYFQPFAYRQGSRINYTNEYQTFNERRNLWINYKYDF
ncbi:TonB-dependent receptor [Helicobacter pullorum]|uniref:TonB-dependent receptor n=1 Tax=Helicobacter pullorum TaxID=35818 RepID=A0A0N0LTG7_9HELI|nr:TonB-dependent receptor [Helicobacter pullorum]KPH55891.1 TonB-dependent receptor [Helicobacter pullorum]